MPRTKSGGEAGSARNCFDCWRTPKPGDVLVVEQVDRLSRLTDSDWRKLRAELDARQVRVVALDLPTSWQLAAPADEFTARMFAALNAMMLDLLAAVARKDYEDRRRRPAQGVSKAKLAGKYRGRPEDIARNAGIAGMLRSGDSSLRPECANTGHSPVAW